MPKNNKPEQLTVAAAYSLACRACGRPVSYDRPPRSRVVECSCGVVNLHPEGA